MDKYTKMSEVIKDIWDETMEYFDYLRENIYDIEWDGIDHKDYPDFCDAYITRAMIDDRELDWNELDILNNDREFVYEKLMLHLY